MKCEDALVMMLDAEPRDLGPGVRGLGVHLGSCQRCAAVAQMLRGETERLARDFSAPHGIAVAVKHVNKLRDPRQFVSPVLALAASVMLWIALKGMTSTPAPSQLQFVASTPEASVARSSQPTKPAQRKAPALVRLPQAPAVMPVAAQAVAVSAVTPERGAVVDAPDVSVDPEPGTRPPTVWRDREARVTVVWFPK